MSEDFDGSMPGPTMERIDSLSPFLRTVPITGTWCVGGSRILADVYISSHILIHSYIFSCVFAYFLCVFLYIFLDFVLIKLIVNKWGAPEAPPTR